MRRTTPRRSPRRLWIIAALSLATVVVGGGVAQAATQAPQTVKRFSEDTANIPNPERGFHGGVDLLGDNRLDHVRSRGLTLARATVNLEGYRDKPLDGGTLARLDAGLARSRQAGVKVVLRFSYNFSGGAPDAPLARALGHIAQLKPVLQRNGDVIDTLQAGFVGAWGEWHSSTNNLTSTDAKRKILAALLDALPADVQVQLRFPRDRKELLGSGIPASAAGRVGYHNDCFLAAESPEQIKGFEDYMTQAVASGIHVGGETCEINDGSGRRNCPNAVREMARYRYSYLNDDYDRGAIDIWRSQGCLEEIRKRLGYRLVLDEARWSSRVRPGGRLRLALRLRNTGFAAPSRRRSVQLVIARAGSNPGRLSLAGVDARQWAPGPRAVVRMLRMPRTLKAGTYRIGLLLADPSPSIAKRGEFAIRFANQGTWDRSGVNWLGSVSVGA